MLNAKLSFALLLALFTVACSKPPDPAAPQQSQPAQDANAVVPPRFLKGVNAPFPEELWGKPGTVTVSAVVGADGKVGETKIVKSPHPELNDLAMNAVKQWQFDPAKQAGKPVPFTITVNVNFAPPANSAKKPAK